jgi:hypothetical protein
MQRIHALPPERQIDFAQSDFEADRTLKAMGARPAGTPQLATTLPALSK